MELQRRDALEALHPLPRAIARELATVPGLWVERLVAAAVRLAICTLLDTRVAWSPVDGRVSLQFWAKEALVSL